MKQLTDERLKSMAAPLFMSHYWKLCIQYARAVIAADRELNNLTGEAQPAREWVGLTDDEREGIERGTLNVHGIPKYFATAIESKLKEKNGY